MKHLTVPLTGCRTGWARTATAARALAVAAAAGAALGLPLEAAAEGLAQADQLLAMVNTQRAAGATCGDEALPPAPALQWHHAMEAAAAEHLQDLAARGVLSHDGSDGSTVGGRALRHGYAWGGVGENVAAGHRSASLTLQQWLNSPAHCRTLMQANYRHVAVVGRYVPGSRYGAWWVMVMARPLR